MNHSFFSMQKVCSHVSDFRKHDFVNKIYDFMIENKKVIYRGLF